MCACVRVHVCVCVWKGGNNDIIVQKIHVCMYSTCTYIHNSLYVVIINQNPNTLPEPSFFVPAFLFKLKPLTSLLRQKLLYSIQCCQLIPDVEGPSQSCPASIRESAQPVVTFTSECVCVFLSMCVCVCMYACVCVRVHVCGCVGVNI